MNTIPLDEPIEQRTHRPLADVLLDLVIARRAIESVNNGLGGLTAKESELKAELARVMESTGIKTGEAHGLQVQLKSRKGQAVTDEIELLASITEAGLLDDFTVSRFNTTAAAKHAVEHGLPGAEATVTTYLSVSEVK